MTGSLKSGGSEQPVADTIDRSPPITVFLSGESFYKAAVYLEDGLSSGALRLRFEMPVYYLYGHAIELILKSFLRAKGFTAKKLKDKFGHSVGELYDGCINHGLEIDAITRATIGSVVAMLAELGRNHEFRYVSTGTKVYPTLPSIREACMMLLAAVRPVCEATVGKPIPDRG